MLVPSRIENYSGFDPQLGKIQPIKKGSYCRVDIEVSGDAPKDFIRVYNYENGVRKLWKKTWPQYIAKVGHKWYPIESISEQIMTRIGQVLDFKIADSKLMMAGTQLRFLSRYFLSKDEILVHAAEIFSGYLGGDKDFAEEIEKQNLARELFTFQFAEKAIRSTFPAEADQLMNDLVQMLIFDAITGNNDRHFYNWGIVTHLRGKKKPTFAPIYDSARGLFWNYGEAKLVEYLKDRKQLDQRLLKYADNSLPKTGWDGLESVNHFLLIDKICDSDKRYHGICKNVLVKANLEKLNLLIDVEFGNLLSDTRRELIKLYLVFRIDKLNKIINK